jgi:large conductance mechanosensitive channel
MKKQMKGFLDFIREQGVVGLAVGLVLGVAVKDVVNSFVESFVNPLLGLILGGTGGLETYELKVGNVIFTWGKFLSTSIDFLVVAAVIYFVVKGLKLDKLDKKAS